MKIYDNLCKLYDYTPEDDMFTSAEECERIKEALELNSASDDDIINTRNMCVLMWTRMMHQQTSNTKVYMKLMNAMMSITAVIDSVKVKREIAI